MLSQTVALPRLVVEVEAVVVVKPLEFSLELGTIDILRETQS